MVSVLELLNARLPILNYIEQKFKEKYGIEKFTGHWNETYYVYIFVASLFHISLLIYGFYLLYTCLKVKRQQGSGTTFVNGLCDVMFACLCMPCYIVYRGFINPCKVLEEVKVVKEYYGIPTQQPVMAQPPVMTQPPVMAQPPVMTQQPVMAQPPSSTITTMGRSIGTTGTLGKTTSTRLKSGGNKNLNKNSTNIRLSNKVFI